MHFSRISVAIKDKVNLITGFTSCLCTPSTGNNTISLTLGALYKIQVFSDEELQSLLTPAWVGTAYDSANLDSINELILNRTPSTDAVSIVFKVILQPVRNIYIKSPNLSSFNTMGCNGQSSIIKKNNVSANPGEMIFANITSGSDFLDCSHGTCRTIEMSITGVNNREISLHNVEWSFTILLAILKGEQ